jgi:hypothetical protein
MGVAPDDQYTQELHDINFQPIFILGVHRSGTSILYKMLTATGSFNPVTAYHIINYHELLRNHHQNIEEQAKKKLSESFKREGLDDRGIDRLKVTADFAEEYGFLLNEQTIRMYLSPRNVPLFTEMCKKIKCIAGNNKPILLKNPYDFSNFLFIKQMFPNAKFVFIHRHPLKTISSTLKAFQMIFQKKHPYMARLSPMYEKFYPNPLLLQPLRLVFLKIPKLGAIYITGISAQATHYYLQNIEKLPKNDYIAITYEEFCNHPQQTIETIMQQLSVKMSTSCNASALMNPRKVNIDDSVWKLHPFIYRSMKKYCNTFQYTMKKE